MKRILFFLMLVLALRLDAAHVVLNLGDFTEDGVTNRKVVWTPPGVSGSGTKVILTDKKLYTVTNSVTISNVVAGVYTVEVQAPPSASRFWLDVPATNGLVNARSILVTSTNSPGAGEVAYSVAASDARFALKTEVSMAEALDAGSVPAVDRLRFPIGNGLYARATVHPNALWLPTNWNGAQVWLAFTGTTNQSATAFGTDTEDPFVYASSDGGNSWTLKSAAPLQSKADSQTVAQWSSSGWQADPELYLDTNGVMRVLWMGFHPYVGSFSNVLFTSHSTDGTTWSTPTVLRKWATDAGNAWSTNAAMAGPQIVATPQGLRLYYVDDGNYGLNPSGVGTNSLWYVSALDGSGTNWNWASATRCTLSPYLTNNVTPWHFDIALVGSNRWYLQYGSQASSFGEYATSTNGVNWSAPGMGLFLSADLKQRPEEYGYYKSTWSAVPGANVPTFAAILGHTPLGQTNVEGWNFSLVRSLVPNPLGLVYTGANTNGLLVGGNALYGGVGRLGALTVVDNFHGSSSGKVALGQPFNGWGGIAIGYNSPMAATNYVLASDGLTETRLNARGSGSVNLSVNNTVKATVTSSNASFAVPLYADGVGLTNIPAHEVLGNLTNVTAIGASGDATIGGDLLLPAASSDVVVGGVTKLKGYTEIGSSNRVILGVGNFASSPHQFQVSSGYRNFYSSTNSEYSEGHGYQNFYASTFSYFSEGHGYRNLFASKYSPYSEVHGYINFYNSTNSPAAYARGFSNGTNALNTAGAWFSGTQVQNPWGWDARGTLNLGALIFGRNMYTNLNTPIFGAAPGGMVGIATTNLTVALNVGGSAAVDGTLTASNLVATAGGLTLPVLTVAPAVSGNNGVLWISNSAAPVLWITTTNGTFAH